MGELTGRDVAAMFAALAGTDSGYGRAPTPSTLHRIRATLRSALNAAIRDGLIRDNPARFVELPSPRRPQAQVWTNHRVEEWRRSGHRYAVAVWTAELVAEKWHTSVRGSTTAHRPGTQAPQRKAPP